MKKIFISGAINGEKNGDFVDNMARMLKHAGRVRKLGAAVYVPCQDILTSFATGGLKREEYLTHDLEWLEVCDALALVPGWGRSEGVKGELARAAQLGIPILLNLEAVKKYLQDNEEPAQGNPYFIIALTEAAKALNNIRMNREFFL